mgnify:CR=1 FL=1
MKFAAYSLAFLVLITTGCLLIPMPERKVLAGHKITDEDTSFIKIGVTTRNDVIRELGQPSLEFEDQRIAAYTWEVVGWHFVWGAWFASRSEEIGRQHVLLIAFDEDNLALRFESTVRFATDTVEEHILKWVEREGLNVPIPPSEFTEIEIPRGQTVIYIYRREAWYQPFFCPLAITIDGKPVAELVKSRYREVILAPGPHVISARPGPSAPAHMPISPVSPISFEALSDSAYYFELEIRTPGLGTFDPVLTIRSKDIALPALKTLKRVW